MEGLKSIEKCELCPRKCGVNRSMVSSGFCNCSDMPLVSSIFLHKGEEPVISGTKGICNVFFAHCNLQCIYCQNYQISLNDRKDPNWEMSVEEVSEKISTFLKDGVRLLGFVSPSHQIPQMIQIIKSIWDIGFKPTIVYNSNGYDSIETLKELEGIIDVYLPDFKYFDNSLGKKFSNTTNYFEVASMALREMYRQKGSTILLDDDGLIESGIIVRHLVLPRCSNDSINILRYIADEISPNIRISLMSQYYPIENLAIKSSLNRKITPAEYQSVVSELNILGFPGWVQELESSDHYKPDFLSNTPFIDSLND
jgi:putative pyruvate formate lyase activating enzyme